MFFDIIFVSYNSIKWIEPCFKSILDSNFDLRQVAIIVVDNNSQDNTLEKLHEIKKSYGSAFRSFKIIKSQKNLGFGRGNNLGFNNGNSPYAFFLNIDTRLEKNTLQELQQEIEKKEENVAMWELRQFPYEHPKYYNPLTLYTSWASGAAFVVERNVFKMVNGFDNHLFMYTEDVDLSWRIIAAGNLIKYVPKAVVYHFCYQYPGEVKPLQHINIITNNILLRYRFGSIKQIIKGYKMVFKSFAFDEPFEGSKKQLMKTFLTKHFLIPHFLKWRLSLIFERNDFKAKFLGWDYEFTREGTFYINELPRTNPKVSIIVRTCSRPDLLRESLISIRNQTYHNIEVVVVEDGDNISEKMLRADFNDLNIKYHFTKDKVGRCRAGNIGLIKADGDYLNFLDDDDIFFSDHVEVLVKQLEKNHEYKIAYSLAFETPMVMNGQYRSEYSEITHKLVYKQRFNRVRLCHSNYIPIQCVMFSKSIFLEEGGLDEQLDLLEDWDLWLRYALKNDFLHIPKVTSLYRVPYSQTLQKERKRNLINAIKIVREKHKDYYIKDASKIAEDVQDIIER